MSGCSNSSRFIVSPHVTSQVEQESDGEEMSDSESAKSVRMEMVEVIKLHMSLEMPEGRLKIFHFSN